MGGGSRVPIPSSLLKTIEDIKEIAGKHSDDDIYAMLNECNLDPDETAQRLMYLDTFHEVKKKRDRRKVNVSNRTSEDSRYAPGMQGRGARGGRGDYSSSYISYDAVGGRNTSARKENGVNPTFRGSRPLPVSHKAENNLTRHFSSSSRERAPQLSAVNNSNLPKGSSMTDANEERTVPPPPTSDVKQPPAPTFALGVNVEEGKSTSSFSDLPNMVSPSVSGVYSSASDPILVPVQNSRISAAVGTIKRQVRSQSTAAKSSVSIPTRSRSSSAHDVANDIQAAVVVVNSTNGMRPRISQEVEKSQHLEPSQPLSLPMDDGCSLVISNQDCQTPQQISPPKVVESEVTIAVEASSQSILQLNVSALEEATSKLDMKLEKLKISAHQPVIFPDHLQVPEVYKNGLTFGSLDATFGQSVKSPNCADDGNASSPTANSIQGNDEAAREVSQSNPSVSSISQEGEFFDHPQSPRVPENLSPLEDNISHVAVSNYDQLKQEIVLPVGPQYPLVQTTPNYTFAFGPPMPGSQLVQSEGSETQVGNATALSTSGLMPPLTQPAGVGQSSTAASPHPVHVLRQPYPPNYFPYGPYFPGYMPHYLHQFLGPGGFPQQPSAGNVYLPPAAAAPGVKLAIPQGKPGTNAVNPSHLGLPPGYGLYNTPVGYNPNAAVISGNEDPAAVALKENNLYTKVQQTEGQLVWFPPSGRDNISNLPANSFYNLHQGQHVMFSPAQVGHGAYTGVYHPAQTMVASSTAPPQLISSQAMAVPVETVGPQSLAYQQSQQALSWSPNS